MGEINVKRLKRVGIPKNRLTFNSTEYLGFSSVQTIQDGESLSMTFETISTELTYLSNNSSVTNTYFYTFDNYLSSIINGSLQYIGAINSTGKNSFTIRRDSGINYVSINGGAEVTLTETIEFTFDLISRTGVNQSFNLYSLDFKGETFLFNENQGTTTTGSNGTVATLSSNTIWNQDFNALKTWNLDGNRPAFRQNGYQLNFSADNSDYLSISTEMSVSNEGDYFEIDFDTVASDNNQGIVSTLSDFGSDYIARLSSNQMYIQGAGGATSVALFFIDGRNTLRLEKVASGFDVTLNGTTVNTTSFTSFSYQKFFGVGVTTRDFKLYKATINGESFNFDECQGNAITGSNGTEATINTSHASQEEYIDATMWEKKGFGLEFDANNSEYLSYPSDSIITNLSDINVSFNVDTTITNNSDQIIFSMGGYNEALTGVFNVQFNANDNTSLKISVGNAGAGAITYSIAVPSGNLFLEVRGVEVYANGVLVRTMTETALNIDNSIFGIAIGRNAKGAFGYNNFVYKSAFVQGESFNLTEGLGNKVYSTPSDIEGTISTSHASSVDRINYGMWQKNGNTLRFNADNSDYLTLASPNSIQGDFTLEFDLTSNLNANTQILATNSTASATNIFLYGGGKIYWTTETDPLYLSDFGKLPNTGSFLYTIERIGNTTKFYVDGSEVDSIDGYNGDVVIDWLFRRGSNYFDGAIKSININGDLYLFKEGEGSQTISESGSAATIETSHASAPSYIDDYMWQHSLDKWLPYDTDNS